MGVADFGSWAPSYILGVIVKLKLLKLFSTLNMDKPGKIGRLRWKERHLS